MSDNTHKRTSRPAGRQRPRSRPAPVVTVQPARRVAYDVLAAVSRDDAYANLLLPTAIKRAALNTADAGLATELCYGTLRLRGYYDRVIELAAGRSIDDIDLPVLDVLRLGAHQLLGMRVPSHAAVNESVSLAREVGSRSASGFVNGVLRTLSRSEASEWKEKVLARAKNADDRLAVEYAHPAWIIRAFRQSLTAEGRVDELEQLLAADNDAPRVNLIALPGVIDAPADAHPNEYSPVGFTLGHGDPDTTIGHAGGRLRVQDEGSQLAALALSRFEPVQPGERWLDLCAGPGGKAALLAAEAAQAGATLVANELVPARVGLVRKALAAFGDTVSVVEGDARRYGQDGSGVRYDRVLLDAPCTGLGALRRRPEARWRKVPEDVQELAVLQTELLDAAVRVLAPGGTLAYVTCSPHLAETRGQVDALMRRHGDLLEQVDTASVVRSVAARDPQVADGMTAQLWPHRVGTDAMFIALFRRR